MKSKSEKHMRMTSIFEIVEYMSALIRSEERKRCTELRIQLMHFEVLNYLSRSNQYTDTPAATAAFFGMTRGTVSQSLIVLEKKGYIEKNKDEIDKRVIHVRLLPPGLAILKKAQNAKLFNAATKLLKKDASIDVESSLFILALNALQKASQTQLFNKEPINKIETIKKSSVFELVECMAALIRAEERKRCTELKLQLVHFQVLEYLSHCNKYSDTPAAITNYLGMTRGTVSQTLILLKKRGFIEKNQDQMDGRIFHIQLLAKGLSVLKQTKPTELFTKASTILEKNRLITKDSKGMFIAALTALQIANNSYSFGICKSCKNFTKKSNGFFCELTQEGLSDSDSKKICQEHSVV